MTCSQQNPKPHKSHLVWGFPTPSKLSPGLLRSSDVSGTKLGFCTVGLSHAKFFGLIQKIASPHSNKQVEVVGSSPNSALRVWIHSKLKLKGGLRSDRKRGQGREKHRPHGWEPEETVAPLSATPPNLSFGSNKVLVGGRAGTTTLLAST